MSRRTKRASAACAACLAVMMTAQQVAGAQRHPPELVSRGELRAALRSAAERRATNVKKIQTVLQHADVARVAGRLLDLNRVSRSLTSLDDRTLERLAVHSDELSEQLTAEGPGKVLTIIALVLILVGVIVSLSLPESS